MPPVTSRQRLFAVCALLVCSTLSSAPKYAGSGNKPHFSLDPKALETVASELTPAEGTDAVVLEEEESYVFDAGGGCVHTQYLLYKVLTQKAAEEWDSISQNWEPWHEERPALRARVITPDLAIHELDPGTIADTPVKDSDSSIYTDGRVVRAPLPAIAPGSIVESETQSRLFESLPGTGIVGRFFFGRVSTPVRQTRLVLEAPSSIPLRYELQLLPGLTPARTESDGRVRIVFDNGRMDPLNPPEHYLPGDTPRLPAVAFSTGEGWQRVAEEYSKIVDSHIDTAGLRSMVSKLVAGKQGRDEKAQAILSNISNNIRYTGVEFGDAAVIPHRPAETLARKYGDCKDKATLLVAMLRAADIPAYVALLNAGSRQDVSAALPGMGMFDHAIVFVPGDRGVWVDVTDEFARFGQLPAPDQGRLALIVRPESRSLVPVDESPSTENVLLERREFFLAENGPALIVETTQPRGIFEPEYRRYYADKENKDNRKNLASYVKFQYLSDKLDRMDRSEPRDFSKPFELVLGCEKAGRGYTDLDSAVAAIRLEGLFSRLPDELQKREPKEDTADKEKPPRKRTADYQLRAPFVAEWQYEIHPPFGFQAKDLPAKTNQSLGPAKLTEDFSLGGNGTVRAVLRFDTVKRRFTVDEAKEMRSRIAALTEGSAVVINFEPVGQALLREGKVRESFQSYRSLISQHPKEAIHHLQIAKALLEAGLGEAARHEAVLAVKLEPSSALAEKTLAGILEHDLVGRKLRLGSDYTGAASALRSAIKLDPDDKGIPAELAILLEYNDVGTRYGSGARLKEAIAEYRNVGQEKLAGLGLQKNLAFALFYAGEFAEAHKEAELLNPRPKSLLAACEAVMNGAKAGIADANNRSTGGTEFKQVAGTAGDMLMNARLYALAADFMEAGASGDTAARTMGLASMLRKARRHEDLRFGNDPREMVLQFLLLTMEPEVTLEKIKGLLSKNALTVLNNTEPEEIEQILKSGKRMRSSLARGGASSDVTIDILMQMIEPRGEGSDDTGYRERLQIPGGKRMTMYVVKEDGRYRVLDTSEKPNAIGLEVLDRVAAGNASGAAVLLDWLRDELSLGGGDDPLSGPPFPRFWVKGKTANADQMKLSAAAILVGTKSTAQAGLAILEEARKAASGDQEVTNLELALMSGYAQLREYEKLRSVSTSLVKRYPESRTAFYSEILALQALGRFEEADNLARERLKHLPDDIDAPRALTMNSYMRGDYRAAHEISRSLVESGKAEAGDLNNLAWNTLFFDRPGGPDLDSAIKASQLSQNNSHILHTLGCLYAETGKIKEAREVLTQAMDLDNLDEPNPEYWYAFGRIAEQYGEIEVAKANYGKVAKPKLAEQIPFSSYQLAQMRLAQLADPTKKQTKEKRGQQ